MSTQDLISQKGSHMLSYYIVRKVNSYYLSLSYGSGQLLSSNLAAGPFDSLSEAEDAKFALLHH